MSRRITTPPRRASSTREKSASTTSRATRLRRSTPSDDDESSGHGELTSRPSREVAVLFSTPSSPKKRHRSKSSGLDSDVEGISSSSSAEQSEAEDTSSHASSSSSEDQTVESRPRSNLSLRGTRGRGRPRGRGKGGRAAMVSRGRSRKQQADAHVQISEGEGSDGYITRPPAAAKRKRSESDEDSRASMAASPQASVDRAESVALDGDRPLQPEKGFIAGPALEADPSMLGAHIQVYDDRPYPMATRSANVARTLSTDSIAGPRTPRAALPSISWSEGLGIGSQKLDVGSREAPVGAPARKLEREERRIAIDELCQRGLATIHKERELIEDLTHPLYLDICQRLEDDWEQRQLEMPALDVMGIELAQREQERLELQAWSIYQEERTRLHARMLRGIEINKRKAFLRHWESDPHGSSFLNVDTAPEAMTFVPQTRLNKRVDELGDKADALSRIPFVRPSSPLQPRHCAWQIPEIGVSLDLEALGLRKASSPPLSKLVAPVYVAHEATPEQPAKAPVPASDAASHRAVQSTREDWLYPESARMQIDGYYAYPAYYGFYEPEYSYAHAYPPVLPSRQQSMQVSYLEYPRGGAIQPLSTHPSSRQEYPNRPVAYDAPHARLYNSGPNDARSYLSPGSQHAAAPASLQTKSPRQVPASLPARRATGNTESDGLQKEFRARPPYEPAHGASNGVAEMAMQLGALPRPSPPSWLGQVPPKQSTPVSSSAANRIDQRDASRYLPMSQNGTTHASLAFSEAKKATSDDENRSKLPSAGFAIPLKTTASGTLSHRVPHYLSNPVQRGQLTTQT